MSDLVLILFSSTFVLSVTIIRLVLFGCCVVNEFDGAYLIVIQIAAGVIIVLCIYTDRERSYLSDYVID